MEEKENKMLRGISNMAKDYAVETKTEHSVEIDYKPNVDFFSMNEEGVVVVTETSIDFRIKKSLTFFRGKKNHEPTVLLMDKDSYRSLITMLNNMMEPYSKLEPSIGGLEYMGMVVIEAKIEGVLVY